MDSVESGAVRLVEALKRLGDVRKITNFTASIEGSKFRYRRNTTLNGSTIGIFSVVESNEPEFADAVCWRANRLMIDRKQELLESSEKHSSTATEKLSEALRKNEEPASENTSSIKQVNKRSTVNKKDKKAEEEEKLFYPTPKSTVEDLFNVMYSEYNHGLTRALRLYTRFGYVKFNGSTVVVDQVLKEAERLSQLAEELNSLWTQQKPVKNDYTLFEILNS